MRLHMLGLPHTRPVSALSHCAYTGKVMRFGPMMANQGFEVLHYGVGEPETTGWSEHIQVVSEAEQESLLGYDPLDPSPEFVGRSTDVSSPLYQKFNLTLRDILSSREWDPKEDIICLPFGHGHKQALTPHLLKHFAVESGIGYPTCITGYRIYESQAWLHWHLGREDRNAWLSEWVAPNYFDVSEWPLRTTPPRAGEFVLYFGRITQIKGMNTVWNLAKMRPDLQFVLCGQGDPTPWMTEPNISYLPPVHGADRAKLFHRAKCLLMPTEYVEPFGGVAVEAMLTGTPVLTNPHGAFTETVPDQFHCRTAEEWLKGLDDVCEASYHMLGLRNRAIRKYSMDNVGKEYAHIFDRIPDIRAHGWHSGAPKE